MLRLEGLVKQYKTGDRALKGIDLEVPEGSIYGLIGPNGAGKTTAIRMILDIIGPDAGTVEVFGSTDIDVIRSRVGYLPEHHRMPRYLSGAQILDFYGSLCGVPRETRRSRAARLLELVGMSDWAKKKISSYSKGMQQRIGLAQALMNDPELIVLDEPTDGVDPIGRREIRDVLVDLRRQGKTIFLNSHLLSELEMVCDRVAILVQGEVVAYILGGTSASEGLAFSSSCHGAGRAMSRRQATRRWQGRAVVEELASRGILIRSPSLRGVAEEAPGAYKDVGRVVEAAHRAGLSRKVARLEPVICVKG